MRADQLLRASRPLTEGHRILLRILAERAVDDFMRECEVETADTDVHQAEELTR